MWIDICITTNGMDIFCKNGWGGMKLQGLLGREMKYAMMGGNGCNLCL